MAPVFFAFAFSGQDLPALLSRLTEEAEVYRHTAPQTLAEETLERRVLVPGGRPGHPHLRTRQIVSEYSLGTLKEDPHEFRQLISVDGHSVAGARQPLEGRVFLRRSDARPLRVIMQAARVENGRELIEYGAVDYIMTPRGSLAPASVLHRSIDGATLVAENRFRYTAFRKFSAASEVKFTDVPEVK